MVQLYLLVNSKKGVKNLKHQFAIIKEDSNKKYISKEMEMVEISDSLIQYISDSLNWIYSIWNGKEKKAGISYYGFSIIEGCELEKFINIIVQWKTLFEFATDDFYLVGEFLPDKKCYKRNYYKRKDVIYDFDSLINLCKKAMEEKAKILHNGI